MTLDEIIEEGRAAVRKRDRESPLSDRARWAVALDLGLEFEALASDDQDRHRHGLEEDTARNLPDPKPLD